MNWLAHLFLSEANVESRLGNLLADIVKGTARQELNVVIQRGIKSHQVIDFFTDSHHVVHRSKQRINSEYRRFAGVLVDVFYDHFLAKNWSKYSQVTLEKFTAEIYASFLEYPGQLPAQVRQMFVHVAREDWLGANYHLIGVENTLERISKRLLRRTNKSFTLQAAVSQLTMHYSEFESDFIEFFPQLTTHVQNWLL